MWTTRNRIEYHKEFDSTLGSRYLKAYKYANGDYGFYYQDDEKALKFGTYKLELVVNEKLSDHIFKVIN